MIFRVLLFITACWALQLSAQNYQQPDERLAQLVDAGAGINWQASASGNWLIQTETAANPGISTLQRESYGLAGLVIDPVQLSAGTGRGYRQVIVQHLQQNRRHQFMAGEHETLYSPRLSPDEQWLAVVVAQQHGLFIELLNLQNGKRRRLPHRLNAIMGIQYQWLADSSGLVVAAASAAVSEVPPVKVPQPKVQETTGKKSPQRTLQNLLQSAGDAAYFEQLLQTRLLRVSTSGITTLITELPLHSFSLSPDNRFVLTQQLQRPYSYRVRYSNFPRLAEVYSLDGQKIADAGRLALHESRKTRPGRRIMGWRPDQPSTLYWVEQSRQKDSKDAVWHWPAPFSAEPEKLYDTAWRFRQLLWSDSALAILYESDSDSEQERAWFFPEGFGGTPQQWYQRHVKDNKALPGEPLTVLNHYQRRVLQLTATGDFYAEHRDAATMRTALLTISPWSGQQQQIWQSAAYAEDRLLQLLPAGEILFSRQTPVQPPELFRQTAGTTTRIVARAHPAPAYQHVSQQFVEYQREDGVRLSGWLYLPAGYTAEQGPLPVLMWAYPREYASVELAEQLAVSPHRFVSFRPASAQPYVALGYAVFDQVSMPIISKEDALPNDDFLPQLKANAEAAVRVLISMGIAEQGNIAIGGHSYGAFMVANLLAHTELFAAGIARSGAYNRTLTPFGFQSEKRHLWEDTGLYTAMSPFLHADKINAPLLLIHGEADPNSGTFPQQSVRMFEALQGLGKNARLVLLPEEGHHYQARESVLHMLWEQQQWLGRHLKPTPAMQQLQRQAE